jgi:hypothetical protein
LPGAALCDVDGPCAKACAGGDRRAYAALIRRLAGLPGQAGLRTPFRRAEATAGPSRARLLGLMTIPHCIGTISRKHFSIGCRPIYHVSGRHQRLGLE